jgi:hypothetical protein
MKLNIAVVLLTLGLVASSSAGQARSTIDKIHIRATLQEVVLLTDFSGKVIAVDFDPRFALTVRIESVGPAANNFTVGAVVAFAIHSPSLLFGEEAKKGKMYNFSVQREIKHGKTRYFGLKVEKVQTDPVVSSGTPSGQVNSVIGTFPITALARRPRRKRETPLPSTGTWPPWVFFAKPISKRFNRPLLFFRGAL